MYTITIEKTEDVVRLDGQEWTVIAKDAADKPVYGYTPEIEKTITRTLQVYEQTVEELNLADVVAVVNKLKHTV